jgi:hypothetical protein
MKPTAVLSARFVVTGLILLAIGCAGWPAAHQTGRFDPDEGVAGAFERYEMNPGYDYYVSGSDACPNAVLGLEKGGSLGETLWKPLPADPAAFKDIIDRMRLRAIDLHRSQHGFVLRDAAGHAIGVWYSLISARTLIRQRSDGTFLIYTPDLDTYDQYKRED